ncbi:DUF421 domain-containing protein [Paenibacillus sp. SC116]|uniref:DUF421 domain-containing protein n=1 Tax=Paenibacillus sp. SC116 TaxID=2968986 RepID=UPI00215A8058|nr:DUF421 domain-containing protein [Paenibacillus sp. SC116]MCR8845999.1 DUF421 domain-containing protein [Paenibacillus sp. SC116]
MVFGTLIFRTILMYFAVFSVMRLMGKREIGKLSIFDLVISIMIAEIAVFGIEDAHKPLWECLVPMGVLVLIQIALAILAMKNRRIRCFFDGNPSFIINQGQLNREEMRKQRYNLDDLMLQLREQGIDSVQDVQFAILEPTGKLTVFLREHAGNSSDEQVVASTEDEESSAYSVAQVSTSMSQKNTDNECSTELSFNTSTSNTLHKRDQPVLEHPDRIKFTSLPLPLIMDGRVMDSNLEKIEKTRFWLKNQIQQKGAHEFKDVFFCSIDHRGRIFVDKMDPKPPR